MIEFLKQLFGLGPKVDLSEIVKAGATILDVRSRAEYSSGHVKGSVNIPLDQLSSNLSKLKDKSQPIITCCASGMRSASAKGILRSAGYINVHNGGAWQNVNSLKKS